MLGNREIGRAERNTDQGTQPGEKERRRNMAGGDGGAARWRKQDWLSTRGFEEDPFLSPVLPPRRN